MSRAIEALLRPRSIAILGASADFQKLNGRTLKALIDKGYSGNIYPVNPKYREIAGLRCYADVSELPAGVELAIVALPAILCGPDRAVAVDWVMVLNDAE